MARGRIRIFGQPDEYISLSRARWLVAARRARFLPSGELHILHGRAHADTTTYAHPEGEGPPVHWTEFSGGQNRDLPSRWLHGYRMNGHAVNKRS